MATKKTPAKAERSGNAQVRTRQASSKAPVASAHRIDKPSATRKPPAKRATKPAKASAKRGAHTPKERVLITGAAGFLGSHLCDRFLKEGYHVIGMDNLITGSLKNIEHLFKREDFEFYSHDVSKFVHVPGELKYILHFASPASPIDYEKIPIQTLKVGSLGTHNLLGLALAKKARILVASTSEVYGDPKVHPQPESYWGHVNPVGKRSMYDEAKRFQEAITMAYHHYHGLETRMVRIFNTYGPRMRLNDGRVVPAFMGQALRGEDLTIFGKGDQTRSFRRMRGP